MVAALRAELLYFGKVAEFADARYARDMTPSPLRCAGKRPSSSAKRGRRSRSLAARERLDTSALFTVVLLAPKLDVARGVRTASAQRNDVVELEALAGAALDAASLVAAPDFVTDTASRTPGRFPRPAIARALSAIRARARCSKLRRRSPRRLRRVSDEEPWSPSVAVDEPDVSALDECDRGAVRRPGRVRTCRDQPDGPTAAPDDADPAAVVEHERSTVGRPARIERLARRQSPRAATVRRDDVEIRKPPANERDQVAIRRPGWRRDPVAVPVSPKDRPGRAIQSRLVDDVETRFLVHEDESPPVR